MRYLIISTPEDILALRVYTELVARVGEASAWIVTDTEIVLAPSFTHRLDGAGVSTEVRLDEDRLFRSADRALLWNRLQAVALPHYAQAAPADRDYAQNETYALWLSWIAGHPGPVIGRPSARGLCFPLLGQLEWLVRASRAGVPTAGLHISTNARRYSSPGWRAHAAGREVPPPLLGRDPAVFEEPMTSKRAYAAVIGDRVVGPLSGYCDQGLLDLARDVGCEVLQASFAEVDDGETSGRGLNQWRLTAVSDLVACDQVVVETVLEHLLRRGHSGGGHR